MADIESLLREKRVFKPPAEFAKQRQLDARGRLKALRALGARDPQRFWAKMARENVTWFKPWKKVLDWKPPFAKWFVGGKLNVSYNCLDRHLEGEHAWRRNKAAIIWEGEPGDVRTLTYGQLHREVCRFANVLHGARRREGRPRRDLHADDPRAADRDARVRADRRAAQRGLRRLLGRGAARPDRRRRREARRHRRRRLPARRAVSAQAGRRRGAARACAASSTSWWCAAPASRRAMAGRARRLVARRRARARRATCKPAALDAEHPLFVLYTSGSTGKPKGILHTTGGYLTHVATTAKAIFDLKDDDIYWCTADSAGSPGHSYVVYGILANGATTLMYEGVPTHPGPGPLLGHHRAPPRDRSSTPRRRRSARFIRLGDEHPNKHDLSSLRLLGTRRRADQPRGVDLVPPRDRRQALPDRRHVVADGDGRDHDHAAAGRDRDEARLGDAAVPGHRRRRARRERQAGARARPAASS